MSLAVDLGGVGMPMEQALRLGFTPATIAGIGTAQVGAAPIPGIANFVSTTTDVGQTAFILPEAAELLVPYIVLNTTVTAALVFPPVGDRINIAGTNNSVPVGQNLARIFMRMNATQWASWLAA